MLNTLADRSWPTGGRPGLAVPYRVTVGGQRRSNEDKCQISCWTNMRRQTGGARDGGHGREIEDVDCCCCCSGNMCAASAAMLAARRLRRRRRQSSSDVCFVRSYSLFVEELHSTVLCGDVEGSDKRGRLAARAPCYVMSCWSILVYTRGECHCEIVSSSTIGQSIDYCNAILLHVKIVLYY